MSRNTNHRQYNTQRRHYRDNSVHAPYYSPDSTARQVSPQIEEQPRRQKLVRRRVKPRFAYDIQARHRYNFLSYVVLLAFFAALAVVLALNAQFEYNQVQLESARGQLAALHAANTAREGEITSELNMEEIERIAIEELGMIVPEEFQLVEISVQPRSFFAHVNVDETVADASFSFGRFWRTLFSSTGGN